MQQSIDILGGESAEIWQIPHPTSLLLLLLSP